MVESASISTLKALVEKKTKKKILVKIMWNDNEKLTLFITPNMKINSFIYDEKEGYLFYDLEGKPIKWVIPCVLSENMLMDGKALLKEDIQINGQSLSKDDKKFLMEHSD
ncbi:hypothetical protein NSA56_12075 [Oceanobacillus caeni]|uniref:hypothetical protein n=1 Tax=Bacillaceae TaxID=186817 RepID=UPI00062227F4|nr:MULTISPECIES: hypothetical protein [Bacillaceae]KKE80469.1 hypothetical protein WH51_01810 [Bacilli bacterium VT-13-104]PZD83192.1 hypothetical protein DEJ64_15780 [Bacilli bacterium]MBU8790717.1 hypothetical protein [Oceanobacillus caeni]MCR1835133.1 hypothetical protein [Oceanobacillus caeni]PZD84390.1 hypothetical protein DEJ60_14805 [Bacilli bacterium]